MRLATLALLTAAALSAPAYAGGYDDCDRGYPDRGQRYVDSSRPSWGVTFGYSSGGYHGDDNFAIGFSYSEGRRYRPVYYSPPPVYCPPVPVPVPVPPPPPPVVYYPLPVYCPPPVVVYPRPYYRPAYRGGYVYYGVGYGYCR